MPITINASTRSSCAKRQIVIPVPERPEEASDDAFYKVWYRLCHSPSKEFDLSDIYDRENDHQLCRAVTDTGGFNLLHVAAYQADDKKLQLFLARFKRSVDVTSGDLTSNATALHVAAQCNFAGGLELLLALPGASVDLKDDEGLTPLHHAVMFKNTEAARELIDQGAALNTWLPPKVRPRLTTLAYVLRRTPYAEKAILRKLDDSIGLEYEDRSVFLVFDLTRWRLPDGSLDLLHVFATEERKVKDQRDSDLIEHPLVQEMLEQSWSWRAHAVYFASLLFKLCYLLSMALVINYKDVVENGHQEFANRFFVVTLALLVLYVCVHLIRWLRQTCYFLSAGASYWRENFVTACVKKLTFQNVCKVLYIPGFILLLAYIKIFEAFDEHPKKRFDANSVAIALFMAGWFEVMVVVSDSRFFRNNFGLYYHMYYIVLMRFVKTLGAFLIFLAGFAICFWMYFKEEKDLGFKIWHLVFAKIFAMLVGEIDYKHFYNVLRNKTENMEKREEDYFLEFPLISIILFAIAVPLLLQSLLIGLVVHDIAEINDRAHALKLKREAIQLNYLLSFCDAFDCCTPSSNSVASTAFVEGRANLQDKANKNRIVVPFSIEDESQFEYLHKAYKIAKSNEKKERYMKKFVSKCRSYLTLTPFK